MIRKVRIDEFWKMAEAIVEHLVTSDGVDVFAEKFKDQFGVGLSPVAPLSYVWSAERVRKESYFTQISKPGIRLETSVDSSQISVFLPEQTSTYLLQKNDISYVPSLAPSFRFDQKSEQAGGRWLMVSRDPSGIEEGLLVSAQDGAIHRLRATSKGRLLRELRQSSFVDDNMGVPIPRISWKVDADEDQHVTFLQLIVLDEVQRTANIVDAHFALTGKVNTVVADFRNGRDHARIHKLQSDVADVVATLPESSALGKPGVLHDRSYAGIFWVCIGLLFLVTVTICYYWMSIRSTRSR